MEYKRILTVQDISCVGQCSMTVALPILSAWGHETCILPTAVLSTHTGGFGKPAVHHLATDLEAIWRHWQRQGIFFDAIYTGYLGSAAAAEQVMALSQSLLVPGGELIVDPAMADHGRVYSGLDGECVEAMLALSRQADILLPNITEAAMLAGIPWREDLDEGYVAELLSGLPCEKVVLTGAGYREGETGVETRENGIHRRYTHARLGGNYHGTGDIFAACFTGARVKGNSLIQSASIAGDFVCTAIRNTIACPAHDYGVKFETALPELIRLAQK